MLRFLLPISIFESVIETVGDFGYNVLKLQFGDASISLVKLPIRVLQNIILNFNHMYDAIVELVKNLFTFEGRSDLEIQQFKENFKVAANEKIAEIEEVIEKKENETN